MVSAAQLREEKLAADRMRRELATRQQKKCSTLPAESLGTSTNIPKGEIDITERRKKLLQEVYDVDSEDEDRSIKSKKQMDDQTATEAKAGDEDSVVIASLKRKYPSDEKLCGASIRKKSTQGDTEDQKTINSIPNSNLKSAFQTDGDKCLIQSSEKNPEITINYKKLAEEIGNVLVLRNLDLNCTSGMGLDVGLSIMKRVVDFGHQEQLENSGAQALEVFGRMGLNVTEFTTGGSFLVNKIDLLQSSMNKTEKMLASANRLLEEKEEEIYKFTQQFSEVECKVEDTKKDLKKLEEKEMSYKSRITELESIAATYEQEKKEWYEDRGVWLNEKKELVADAEAAQKVSWNTFVEQYEKSTQLEKKVSEKTLGCYEQGMCHALRMAAASGIQGITAETLANWAKTAPYSDEGRRGHLIVPYSKEEVEELRDRDLKNEMPKYDLPEPLEVNVKTLMGIEVSDAEDIVEEVPHSS